MVKFILLVLPDSKS